MVAVLGNHDYHRDEQDAGIRRALEDAGVRVLENEATTIDFEFAGQRLGIAGTKGFGGGFAGALLLRFRRARDEGIHSARPSASRASWRVLTALDGDVRIVLLHYALIPETLDGERLELFPSSGSMLGEAIDHSGAELALHGHAHHGSSRHDPRRCPGPQRRAVGHPRPVRRLHHRARGRGPPRSEFAPMA